jgi:hypothetical protein
MARSIPSTCLYCFIIFLNRFDEILGFWCAGGATKPLIAFSAVGVDSRSSIFGVDSTAAAVAGPVDINAMMARGGVGRGDDDDTAAAGAAALAAARAAASARPRCLRAIDWNETKFSRIVTNTAVGISRYFLKNSAG